MLPAFYQHCAKLPDGLDLLFAHRWILLCFKREFPERGSFGIVLRQRHSAFDVQKRCECGKRVGRTIKLITFIYSFASV